MVVEMDHNMPVDCWVFEHFLNGFFSQKHEQLGLNGFPHKTSQSYSIVRSPSLCRWSCDEKLVAPGCLLQMNLAECHRGFRSVPRQESCRQRCHIPLSGRWATWFMSHLGSLGPSEWPLADLGPKNSGTNMDQHGPIWTSHVVVVSYSFIVLVSVDVMLKLLVVQSNSGLVLQLSLTHL